jgi:hypothetical protein
MALTPEQQQKYNQMRELMPEDAVSGFEMVSPSDNSVGDGFAKFMREFSKHTKQNAFAYYNYDVKKGGPRPPRQRKATKVISPDGFPPDITISYAYPPPFAFRTEQGARKIKHFVMHSFGHGWHARPGNQVGWLNSSKSHQGSVPVQYKGKTVYMAKGTEEASFTHRRRMAAGLNTCLNPTAKATAHFFIDRAGNLVIIGDCNDVMYTSNVLNSTSVGVELEECFYVTEDPKVQKAEYRYAGEPPGTRGNIVHLTYSDKQMLTLSILCKKLEIAYPELQRRNILIGVKGVNKSSPPGYTMHNFIEGSKHLDVSPHFFSEDYWHAFFQLVDAHTHINSSNIFRPAITWEKLHDGTPPPTSKSTVTQLASSFATLKDKAAGRAFGLLNQTRNSISDVAGRHATALGNLLDMQTAVLYRTIVHNENVKVGLPADEQAIQEDGTQINSDQWW